MKNLTKDFYNKMWHNRPNGRAGMKIKKMINLSQHIYNIIWYNHFYTRFEDTDGTLRFINELHASIGRTQEDKEALKAQLLPSPSYERDLDLRSSL